MENKNFCDSQKKNTVSSDSILSALDACISGANKILNDPKKRERFRRVYRGIRYWLKNLQWLALKVFLFMVF